MMRTQKRMSAPMYWLSVVAVGLIVGFGVQFAKAWVDPVAAPPGGNVAGPVTTGNAAQVKSGALGVGGLVVSGNEIVTGTLQVSTLNAAGCDLKANASGILYCGTDAAGVGGDNLGNHVATTHLNMNGQFYLYNMGLGKAIAWGSTPGAGDVIYDDGSNMAVATVGDFFVLDRNWNTNNVIANNYWIGQTGRWASDGWTSIGGIYDICHTGPWDGWNGCPQDPDGCWAPNPFTGACSCPAGYGAVVTGLVQHYEVWSDGRIEMCVR